ncbi:MAG TPA: HEAT repeat domain-containing protein, partial [Cyclobacteriaceae bacterium]
MENEKLQSLIIDYIDGSLSDKDKIMVEHELQTNEECRLQFEQLKEVMNSIDMSSRAEPSSKLKLNFEHALLDELESSQKGKQVFMSSTLYKVAAAITLLIVGGGIGFWVSKEQARQAELQAIRDELNSTKSTLMAMMKDKQSASQRLQGVTVAYNMEKADDEIINALIKAMNTDPNTNVRLAALDALGKFHQQESVRKALIASLSIQKDPVVQISLIRLMVEMK